jgi:hypothetical protein
MTMGRIIVYFIFWRWLVVNRLTLTLEQSEYAALLKFASEELRNPSDQAHHIIREKLLCHGFLILANEKQRNWQNGVRNDSEK